MTLAELHHILARGEDSRHQFKRDFNNVDAGSMFTRDDDRQGNRFRVVIPRSVESATSEGLSRDQVGARSGPSKDQARISRAQ